MTHFERTYLLNRPRKIAVSYNDGSNRPGGVIDLTGGLNDSRRELALHMEYRELDRQSMELEKEIPAVKALRMELEKFKVEFGLTVEDEATKKIQGVMNEIEKMFSR